MSTINLLVIDASEGHTALMVDKLKEAGYQVAHTRVDTKNLLTQALDDARNWDAVVCDYALPNLDPLDALKQIKDKGLDLPFVLVSRNIGEETVAMLLKGGAHDFISRSNLARLVPAIEREMKEASVRRERRNGIDEKDEMYYKMAQAWKLASLGTLAAGLAHELNNPLAAIKGYAELFEESDGIPTAMKEKAKVIVTASLRMITITDHLRCLAHESGKSDWKRIDVRKPIEDSLMLLEQQLNYQGIRVELSKTTDTFQIWGDHHHLESVFQNLLANSRDAFGELTDERQKRIRIAIEQTGTAVQITYEDNGPGMSEEVKRRVFDAFFTTKKTGSGVGIGMSIVNSVIEQHRGSIRVESELGRGTKFIISFPLDRRAAQRKERTAPKDQMHIGVDTDTLTTGSRPKPKLLIIDDESMVLNLLAELLADDFSVKTINDPLVGLEEIRSHKYDLVMTDNKMKGASGCQVLFAVKEHQPSTPVVMMSGSVELNPDVQNALKNGAAAFLKKPFPPRVLLIETLRKSLVSA